MIHERMFKKLCGDLRKVILTSLVLTAILFAGPTILMNQTVEVEVHAKSNIFAAGKGSTADYGGGQLPVPIDIPAGEKSIKFNVSGSVGLSLTHCLPDDENADGNTCYSTHLACDNAELSGIKHRSRSLFLVGVFLDDSVPSAEKPAMLYYYSSTDTSFQHRPPNVLSDGSSNFFPELKQIFFIGDGIGAYGSHQVFHVPYSATRLYLGFTDGWKMGSEDPENPTQPGYYFDNFGKLNVTLLDPIEDCDYCIAEKKTGSGNLFALSFP